MKELWLLSKKKKKTPPTTTKNLQGKRKKKTLVINFILKGNRFSTQFPLAVISIFGDTSTISPNFHEKEIFKFLFTDVTRDNVFSLL